MMLNKDNWKEYEMSITQYKCKVKINITIITYKHVIETLSLKNSLLVGQIWPIPIIAVCKLLTN